MRRRWWLFGFLGVLLLLFLAAFGLWRSEAFWRWSGEKLLDLARERLGVEIKVGDLKGRPLTGLTLREVVVTTPQGEVLRVRRLEVRLSPWSIIKGQPVIGHLALEGPSLTLRTDQPGPFGPGQTGKSREEGKSSRYFKSLSLPEVVIKGGEVTVIRGRETWRLQDLEGLMALDLIHPGQTRQRLLVRRAALSALTPWGPVRLTGRLAYRRQHLELLALSLASNQRPWLNLAGEVDWVEPEGVLRLLGELGPLPGEEVRRLWPRWPGSWDVGGKFSLQGSLSRSQIRLEGRLAEADCTLEGSAERTPGGWETDLRLVLANLKPDLLIPFNPRGAEGLTGLTPVTARLNLKARGAVWPPAQFNATLALDPCRLAARRLEQANLTLAGNPREQQFSASLKANFGQLTLNARGPLLAASRGDLEVRLEGFKPDLLGLSPPPETVVNAKFTGNFRLPRWSAPAELALAGDLEGGGRLGRFPLREARGRLTWEKPRLTIAQAKFHLGNLRGEVQGFLEKDRLDLKYQGSLTPGDEGPLPEKLKGQLSWQGTLAGDLKAPRYGLEGKGAHLAYEGLGLEDLRLKLSGEGWPPRGGSLELQGRGLKTPGVTFARATVSSQGSGENWSFRLKASSPGGLLAELTGAAALGARPLEITLAQVRCQLPQAVIQNVAPVRVRLLPGLEIPAAAFRVQDGRLTLEARVREGAVSGRFEVENLPAHLVAVRGHPLDGRLRGGATLSGEARQPVMKGQFSLSPGKVGQFSFQSLQTSLGYQGNQLSLSGSLEQRAGGPRLTWEGRLPLRLSLIPFRAAWGEEDVRLRLQGEKTDLSLLTALTPEVQAAEGSVDLSAEWQGPMPLPQVSGQVRWGAGSIKFRQTGALYRLLPGVMRLQGNTLKVPQLVFESGGTATVTGEIRLAGFFPQDLDLRAHLENFKAVTRAGSEAYGTGDVYLKGPIGAPVLTGRLQVPQASFRPIFFQTSLHDDIVRVRQPEAPPAGDPGASLAPGLVRNLSMNILLETSGGVWVRDPRFKAEVAATIRATKQPGEPAAVGGEIRSLQGTIDIQDRTFKLVEGALHLPGKPRVPIIIECRAIHEMTDVTLVLNISGPVKKPEIKFSSIPALPPQDILSYLLFGRPVRTLSREEYQVVSPQAMGVLGGITAKKLQELLGKDFPLLGDVTLKGGETRMGVAKPLTKDISISFERKTNPLSRDDMNQIRLEYRINRYLGVESQMGRRNSGADVLFNFDF